MIIPDLAVAARFAANHLWQSTLTACAAAVLVHLLRNGEARLRHAIWMAASLKFFVPLALLVALGERLGSRHVLVPSSAPALNTVLEIGQPFTALPSVTSAAPTPVAHFPWYLIIAVLWAAGVAAILISWIVRWRRVRLVVHRAVAQPNGREGEALRAACIAAGIRRPISLLLSADSMEPGVCGILRPSLLWPAGISPHLDNDQLAAIVAHEVCHVQRRDNLFAFLQMCVQALFWFHPLVWWMGARLLEERERACDEAVLRLGNEPARYAEAILKACRFCVESPLTCVSGVSGSDLKRRMVRIMNAATVPLSRSRKMLLASVAVATISGPFVLGALHPRIVKADDAQDQKFTNLRFDSASLTPAKSNSTDFMLLMHDNEFIDHNVTLKDLIAVAYGVKPDRIVGGPDWVTTQRFDFEAHWTPAPQTTSSVPPPPAPEVSLASVGIGAPTHPPMVTQVPAPGVLQAMMRHFLAERLNLNVRQDSAVLPVFELVVANGGSKLIPTQAQPTSNVTRVRMDTRVEATASHGEQRLAVTNGPARVLCDSLSERLGHEVVDKTGLTGRYDFQIAFPAHADADQLASILRDQYGLDLQSTQQPVTVFAIDNVNMPQAQ